MEEGRGGPPGGKLGKGRIGTDAGTLALARLRLERGLRNRRGVLVEKGEEEDLLVPGNLESKRERARRATVAQSLCESERDFCPLRIEYQKVGTCSRDMPLNTNSPNQRFKKVSWDSLPRATKTTTAGDGGHVSLP